MDCDGDGTSTYGDRFAFNHWLELGGKLDQVLLSGQGKGDLLDVSGFLNGPSAALSPAAAILTKDLGGGGPAPAGLEGGPGHIDFTRRIPQVPTPNSLSKNARMTPDGQFIVLCSMANLDGGAPGGGTYDKVQIFRIRIQPDDAVTIDLASRTTAGAPSPDHCFHPCISDDGTKVVFCTAARLDPTVDPVGNTTQDIYVREFPAGGGNPTTKLLSRSELTQQAANGTSRLPGISGNGGYVAFTSSATNLDAQTSGFTGLDNVFSVNTTTLAVGWVSRSNNPADPKSNAPMRTTDATLDSVGRVLNHEGAIVAFQGAPSNWTGVGNPLVDPQGSLQGNTQEQIFVRAFFNPPSTILVSRSEAAGRPPGNGRSRRATLSAQFVMNDGCVAFSSTATNLDPFVAGNAVEDIFLVPVDVENGSSNPRQVMGFAGALPDGESHSPMLDEFGTHVAFTSKATNLTDPVTDADVQDANQSDIFVTHSDNCPNTPPMPTCAQQGCPWSCVVTRLVSRDCDDEQALGSSGCPDIALNGRVVTYHSSATNLVDTDQDMLGQSDTNGFQDVFQTGVRPHFVRGDANGDDEVDLSDSIFINDWLFLGQPRPACVDAADVDDTGNVNITDGIYLLNFLFGNCPEGPPCPPPPAPHPG